MMEIDSKERAAQGRESDATNYYTNQRCNSIQGRTAQGEHHQTLTRLLLAVEPPYDT